MKRILRLDAIDQLKFDEDGTIAAILQDTLTKDVIGRYWMNKESLEKTFETGRLHIYRKDTGKVHLKGDKSGNFMKLDEILVEKDKDVLLIKVILQGNKKGSDDSNEYSDFGLEKPEGEFIDDLYNIMVSRKEENAEGSYTVALLRHDRKRLKKLMESATDVIIDASNHDRERLITDTANLFYHTLIILIAEDVTIGDIKEELYRRRK